MGSRWLRLAGTAAGLGLLLHTVDVGRAADVLGGIDPEWALAGVLLTAATVATGVAEWGLMLRVAAPQVGWWPLALWYLQGVFVGQVTPSGGGYAVQVLAAGRVAGRRRAVAALAAGRMAGTLAMAAFGLAGAARLHSTVGRGVLAGSAVYVAFMVAVWPMAFGLPRLTRACRARRPRLLRTLAGHLEPFTGTFAELRRRPGTVLATFAVCALGWLLQLFALRAFGESVGVHVPWTVYAVSVPIALLAGIAPLSVGGIGLREGVLVGLLAHFGVDPGRAAALTLLMDLQRVPVALAGAAVFAHARRAAGGAPAHQPAAAEAGAAA
jgi:uncharacterized protein (TIRG00374 family)